VNGVRRGRPRRSRRGPLASLRTLGISAPGGEHIPLQQIAEITKEVQIALAEVGYKYYA